jgi:hypothetical protein
LIFVWTTSPFDILPIQDEYMIAHNHQSKEAAYLRQPLLMSIFNII